VKGDQFGHNLCPPTVSFPRKRESLLADSPWKPIAGPGDARLVLVKLEPDGR